MKTSRFCPNLWSSLVWIFAHVVHSSWVSPFPPHFSSLCSTDFFLSLSGKNDLFSVDRTPPPQQLTLKLALACSPLSYVYTLLHRSIQRSSHIFFFIFFFAVCGPLTVVASPVAKHRLRTRRPSSHGSRAQPLRGMWDLPGPGHEPVSPASAGGLSTTAPPGKPRNTFLG